MLELVLIRAKIINDVYCVSSTLIIDIDQMSVLIVSCLTIMIFQGI